MSVRIPELDGLRAIAVWLVIVVHVAEPALPGGWIGVDIFFVLSGFLITSILLGEYDRVGRISLGRFYMRRFLRLTPALVLLLIANLLYAAVLSRQPLIDLKGTAAAALYMMDFVAASHDSGGLLGHTWSLAIEEKFYLIWPLILMFVLTSRIQRGGAGLAALIVLSCAV